MPRYANVEVLSALGVSDDTMRQIPSSELALIADAIRSANDNSLQSNEVQMINFSNIKPPVKKLRKGSSLATAMKMFGINREVNAKGDKLLSYHPNRPKYPFVYLSGSNGRTRWKQTAEQAARRFR